MRTPFPKLPNSRRKTSRVEAPEVRVYWSSGGRNDLLRVRNLSFGGMFVETRNPQSVGSTALIDFLVEEGQIRTKAVVRHIKNASGMGLQFTVVAHEDRPRLAALLTRLRASPQSHHNPPH
jgi:c-di-GMP-binding flagellar brake protein YcgR